MNGEESVKAWMDGIKPEHVIRAKQVDTLIKELIPEIQCTSPHILNVMAGLKYRIG